MEQVFKTGEAEELAKQEITEQRQKGIHFIRITKSPTRKLTLSEYVDGFAILSEETAYTPIGYSRCKWDKSIIAISKEELRKILDLLP